MANREKSGSDSAQPNRRPNGQSEEGMPEMNDDVRNMSDEADDEFEDTEDLDEEEDDGDEEIR